MPAVLVMQIPPFSSLAVAVAIASTHCAYRRRGGQVELTRVAAGSLWALYIDVSCWRG